MLLHKRHVARLLSLGPQRLGSRFSLHGLVSPPLCLRHGLQILLHLLPLFHSHQRLTLRHHLDVPFHLLLAQPHVLLPLELPPLVLRPRGRPPTIDGRLEHFDDGHAVAPALVVHTLRQLQCRCMRLVDLRWIVLRAERWVRAGVQQRDHMVRLAVDRRLVQARPAPLVRRVDSAGLLQQLVHEPHRRQVEHQALRVDPAPPRLHRRQLLPVPRRSNRRQRLEHRELERPGRRGDRLGHLGELRRRLPYRRSRPSPHAHGVCSRGGGGGGSSSSSSRRALRNERRRSLGPRRGGALLR